MRRFLAFGEESMRGLDKDSIIDVSRFDLLSWPSDKSAVFSIFQRRRVFE
jgi:hypothetical protein